MEKKLCNVSLGKHSHQYDVEIGQNLLFDSGVWAKSCVSDKAKTIAVISNAKVFGLYGDSVESSLRKEGFEVFVFLMEDGEEFKNFESLSGVLDFLGEKGLRRTDVVLALGGGVVGDLAGFAASVYLRGLAFLQLPTTFLSMIDSSVGGKTGVNTSFGKNTIGAFHQPDGVLIDVRTLQTLDGREVLAGFCEAIKHGAIGGVEILGAVDEFLSKFPLGDFPKYFSDLTFLSDLINLIHQQVCFKADVVINDEKEGIERNDVKSRKILNFGHTVGHALEKVTNYNYFKHGEAVGYGVLAAVEISKRLDILDNDSIKLLKNVVSQAGKLPGTTEIEIRDVIDSFSYDKKSLGEELQWVLLEEIGKPKIVSSKEIPENTITGALQEILHK